MSVSVVCTIVIVISTLLYTTSACDSPRACSTILFGDGAWPPAIKANDGDTLRMKSVYFPNQIVAHSEDDQQSVLADLTQRAFCINDVCSIPGPTLVVYPGITVHIEFENAFDVDSVGDLSDHTDPGITNIHSHGLHISGLEDDIFRAIHPGQTESFTWTIHPEHHLGTNWYHAHHHHSTALHIQQGMYGALIVDAEAHRNMDDDAYRKEYLLQISWTWLHDEEYCSDTDCESVVGTPGYFYFDSWTRIPSLCETWCEYTQEQRNGSGYVYDVQLADGIENQPENEDIPSFEGFLVNNQHQPQIKDLKSWEYAKLRFIQASPETYVQLAFDYNAQTKCQYWMIARDGVAIQNEGGLRDLSQAPYDGYFLLPPGGRLDVLVMCKGKGVADIYHDEVHPSWPTLSDSYPMGRVHRQKLFSLHITDKNNEARQAYKLGKQHKKQGLPPPPPPFPWDLGYRGPIGPIPDILTYPEPVLGYPYYLQELIDTAEIEATSPDSGIETECVCANFARERVEDVVTRYTERCSFELVFGEIDEHGNGLDDIMEINGMTFDSDASEAIFDVSLNQMYEFYVNSDGHPLHIHVNPFMVMEDLLQGYVAQQYDIMDTIGYKLIGLAANWPAGRYPEREAFIIRINARDYVGNVFLHCHLVHHEDLGMMAFFKVVDGETDNATVCETEYGYDRMTQQDSITLDSH